MNTEFPGGVRLETSFRGVHYALPSRDMGPARFIGVVPLLFGLVFAGFAVVWMALASGLIGQGQPDSARLLFALFGIPFFLVGCGIIGVGVFILAGRSEMSLVGTKLHVTERAGPIRWRRRFDLEGVRKLQVVDHPSPAMRSQSGPAVSAREWAALTADLGTGKPKLILNGYPKDTLMAIANDLSQRLRLSGMGALPTEVSAVVAAPQGFNLLDVDADREDQPPGSKVRVEPQGDGMILNVPPAGLWKGSKGLLAFSLFWLLICGLFAVLALNSPWNTIDQRPPAMAYPLFAVVCLVGFGMLAVAINMGRRRAVILVNSSELEVVRQGPFGTKRWVWPRDQIARVVVAPSTWEVNGRPVNELQIYQADGKFKGLFMELDDEELRWMATILRDVLQMKPARSAGPVQ